MSSLTRSTTALAARSRNSVVPAAAWRTSIVVLSQRITASWLIARSIGSDSPPAGPKAVEGAARGGVAAGSSGGSLVIRSGERTRIVLRPRGKSQGGRSPSSRPGRTSLAVEEPDRDRLAEVRDPDRPRRAPRREALPGYRVLVMVGDDQPALVARTACRAPARPCPDGPARPAGEVVAEDGLIRRRRPSAGTQTAWTGTPRLGHRPLRWSRSHCNRSEGGCVEGFPGRRRPSGSQSSPEISWTAS